jgi:hypothetical protein
MSAARRGMVRNAGCARRAGGHDAGMIPNVSFLARLVVAFVLCAAPGAHAELPDAQRFPAAGERLLLWVASEHGREASELAAARRLAARGVEVWSLDLLDAYFLPPLPASLEQVPLADLVQWLQAAHASGKRVTLYAVGRAAGPLLRAAARLPPDARARLCVLLMHPSLYASAEALADPVYLDLGTLDGLRVRVLQPRRAAGTLWLQGLTEQLAVSGADVEVSMLENLREGFWAREDPTDYEIAETGRLADRLMQEMETQTCP